MRKTKKKTPRISHKSKTQWSTKLVVLLLCLLSVGIGGVFYVRNYYPALYQKMLNRLSARKVNTLYEQQRIDRIVGLHREKVFGIDLSHYQEREEIAWDSLYIMRGKERYPLQFAVFRATMGNEATDNNFAHFWETAKERGIVRGAYHYYRPDEDPVKQAVSYLRNAPLEKGDFLPILDVEKLPKNKTKEQFLEEIGQWLSLVEQYYQRKPILYTYINFYETHLYPTFKDYPLWVANYNNVSLPTRLFEWELWQFTENGITAGARVKIDFNVFNGSKKDLQKLLL